MPTNNSLFLDFPPEENLTPDGNPLITPEELAAGPSIPVTASQEAAVLDRLCEYTESTQAGCRRTQTILALEAEFDTFAHPEMQWCRLDHWCRHEGHIYYYKYMIEKLTTVDDANLEDDFENSNFAVHHAVVEQNLGSKFRQTTLEDVSKFFRNSPVEFPKLQTETLQFFQCEDVGNNHVSIDNLNRDILNTIQQTFTSNITPLFANLSDSLYLFEDKIYCTDFLAYGETELPGLGVLMIPTESEKYEVGNAYFFPFSDLTEEQAALITSIGLLELELNGEVVFVKL
jgi:hypothetical protein